MENWREYEVYLTGILFVVTIWLVIHTYRYYKAKKRMFRHMKRFAKEGDVDAELYVADEYRKGDVIKKSCEQALFWYHKAALEGDERAKKYLEDYNKNKKKGC
jgi:TPR repeat protein